VAILLHIETSGTNCSVSISKKDQVLDLIEKNEGMSHAENLHPFIKSVLDSTSLKPEELNAVCISAGPGSYTGLRIGLSAAKGFCFALNIPLIALNTLQVMAAKVNSRVNDNNAFLCSMLDARRMEVYTALYNASLEEISKTEAKIMDETSYLDFEMEKTILFFGSGMPKCKEILSKLPHAQYIEDIYPSAENMAFLAYQKFINSQWEDLSKFEPLYLKEFFTSSTK